MYRIELEPGDVGVFRSVEEIATAIKSGVITTRARIYHQASDKWLPIEYHPHYKQALEIVAGGGKSSSAPPSSGGSLTFVTPSGPRAAVKLAPPEPEPVAEVKAASKPEPVARPQPAPEPEPIAEAEPVADAESEYEPDDEEAEEYEAEEDEPEEYEAEQPEPVEEEAAEPEADTYAPIADRVSAPFVAHVPAAGTESDDEDDPEPETEAAPHPVAQHAPVAAHGPVEEFEPVADFAPAPFAELISFESPAGSAEEHAPIAVAEPRPIVRPRLRMEIAGKPRRSFLMALAGMVLVCTTQLGLTAPERFGLDIRSLGLFQPSPPAPRPVLSRGATEGTPPTTAAKAPAAKPIAAAPAPASAPAPATAAGQPQITPSFGASSAFTPAATGPQPLLALPRREPPAAAKAPAADSIVAAAPAPGEIAIGAPVVPIALKPTPAPAPGRLTAAALVARYQAAYAAARSQLETGLQTAGFANLFAIERLTSPAGVRTARLSAGTASAYVAKYHRREAEIEQAYADSFATMGKLAEWSADERRAWESRQVLREKPEVTKLASFLLAEIDSVYGILSSQEGAYDIKGGTITFQDAKAAHAYAELRPWLDRKTHQWADTASGAPTTAARVLRAIGSTKLPEGGAL